VKSNIVGAAAYWGKDTLLKMSLMQIKSNLAYKTQETSDPLAKK
jgi:hypothetical protein